jgi:hypothetical protein
MATTMAFRAKDNGATSQASVDEPEAETDALDLPLDPDAPPAALRVRRRVAG